MPAVLVTRKWVSTRRPTHICKIFPAIREYSKLTHLFSILILSDRYCTGIYYNFFNSFRLGLLVRFPFQAIKLVCKGLGFDLKRYYTNIYKTPNSQNRSGQGSKTNGPDSAAKQNRLDRSFSVNCNTYVGQISLHLSSLNHLSKTSCFLANSQMLYLAARYVRLLPAVLKRDSKLHSNSR